MASFKNPWGKGNREFDKWFGINGTALEGSVIPIKRDISDGGNVNVGGFQSSFNIDKAVNWLDNNAKVVSQHACAKYVRLALEAGGINTNPHPVSAKDYGPFLQGWGFNTLSSTNYSPIKGDIRVFQPYPGGSQYGHIDMYNGNQWLSDFKEKNEFPGSGYRNSMYALFRWTDNNS